MGARPVAEINGQQAAVRRSDFNTGEGGFYLSSFTRRRSCGYIPVHIAFQVEGIADQHSRATMERTGVTRLNPLHISEAADQNGGEEVGGDIVRPGGGQGRRSQRERGPATEFPSRGSPRVAKG